MSERINKVRWWLLRVLWVGFMVMLVWVLAGQMVWDNWTLGLLVGVLVIVGLESLRLYSDRRVAEQQRRVAEGRCAKCGYDLRASGERCPECGTEIPIRPGEPYIVPLRDDWPAEPNAPRQPLAGEEKVRVYTGPEGMEQDLLVQQLRARGVACFITRRKARGIWLYAPPPWVNDVHVWSGDEADARRIIERMVDENGLPRRERRKEMKP